MFRSASMALAGVLAATSTLGSVQAFPQDDNSLARRATACNNSPSLCSRNYNDVTFMGVHDSAFLRNSSSSSVSANLAGNQYQNATQALDAGFRFLQAQVHNSSNSLHLCHTSCSLLDAGPLENFLGDIGAWMDSNANEVVTLLFVNSDSAPVDEWGQAFVSSGITKYSYNGTMTEATSNWPTLQSMISSNQRLVSFVTDVDSTTTYPYLRDEFHYIFETSYEVTSLDGFNCTLDRPVNREPTYTAAIQANYLSLLNHFKEQTIIGGYVPDTTTILTVNSPNTTTQGSVGQHLESCKSAYGKIPNFVLLDFWSAGDAITAGDAMNGLNDVTGRTVSDDEDDTTASGNKSNGVAVESELGRYALVAALAGSLLLF